jgi:hypothetical protein
MPYELKRPVRYEWEYSILDEILRRRPETCEMRFPDWNSATSMQARFNRAIRHTDKTYQEFTVDDPLYDKSPFKGLILRVINPGLLQFIWGPEATDLTGHSHGA